MKKRILGSLWFWALYVTAPIWLLFLLLALSQYLGGSQ